MKALLLLPFLFLSATGSAIPVCNPSIPSCNPEPIPDREFKTFTKPVIEGGRLDWCQNWATDCGRPAAQAFCEFRGYDGVTSFSIDKDIGYTKLISGAICSAPHCDGFAKITCYTIHW